MTGGRTLKLAAALALVAGIAAADDITKPELIAGCAAPPELLAIGPALTHVAARIERGEPLTIVAVGSSSTQGTGASTPAFTYPTRLEAELKARLPGIRVRVVNRGKGGEEAPQMLARMDREVISEHPDLVVWQLGTNAVLRHDSVADEEAVIDRGLARLKASGADVVLMDMQYAPRVLTRPAYAAMEKMIAGAAKRDSVGLFRRFALMQYWESAQPADAPAMVGPDGLHMNDRGYGCIAAELAEAVAENWRVQEAARRQTAERYAGLTGLWHTIVPVEAGVP